MRRKKEGNLLSIEMDVVGWYDSLFIVLILLVDDRLGTLT